MKNNSRSGLNRATWITQAVVAVALLFSQAASAAITYVQSRANSSFSNQTTIAATFLSAQTAGNFNAVIVAWNNGSFAVNSIVDTRGNVYTLAVGPTVSAGNATQSIYYAKNIVSAAAGANTVTVTFSGSVAYPDIRVAEYSGVDTSNPFDVGVGSTGSGLTMSGGPVTTTNANDLLVAGNVVAHTTIAPDPLFTQRTNTSTGSILEDRIVSATGSYSAGATQQTSGFWVMQIAAFKAAGGGGDAQAPTPPTNLNAVVVSSTQINLTWTASTDNVGVTGYRVERCLQSSCTYAEIGLPTTTSFNNTTGLTASTAYRYRVSARDAAGNWSGPTNPTVNATTSAADTQAPTPPTGLNAVVISSTQINLTWTASSDNVGVTGYRVERCLQSSCTYSEIGLPTATSFNNTTGLSPSTAYRYRVSARDAAGNWSGPTNPTVDATTQAAGDVLAPTKPLGLNAVVISSTQINLTWSASSDNVGVTGYRVERCLQSSCTYSEVGLPTTTSFNNTTGLSPSTGYRYQVSARDAAGNWSTPSDPVNATTFASLVTPNAPTVTAASNKEIDIAWTAVSGAVNYIVERCQGVGCNNYLPHGSQTPNLYLYDANLTAVTSYSYRVRAVDGSGGQSLPSTGVSKSTLATAACD